MYFIAYQLSFNNRYKKEDKNKKNISSIQALNEFIAKSHVLKEKSIGNPLGKEKLQKTYADLERAPLPPNTSSYNFSWLPTITSHKNLLLQTPHTVDIRCRKITLELD